MIKGSQITKGMVIIHSGEPHKVMDLRNTMSGRGSNTISTKLRNILNGIWANHRFKSDDKVEKAFIERRDFEYLYADGEEYWFMDLENYEQVAIQEDELKDVLGYLIPNSKVMLQIYDEKPIGCEPQKTIEFVVSDTEPGLKGATASSNVTKPATVETGLIVQVPMFIETGDKIIVNTVNGEYSGRPSK